mmetsp:Transcript_43384/g.99982  ORF Transcript_43384/g.99982 Transcript_43384/m.99982 type:complete len:770 (+) Transcript_43384:94-2403(+)
MGLFDYWGVLGTGIQSFFAWAAFNQSAFADNVAMRQNQKYQQQNYQISWIAIARDDIRDMMGISVNRINNYMIVATLILSIAASTIVSVKFGPSVPDFIVFAFYTCLGISLVFLTLAIMFGVKGQNCAFTNTMKLLTYQVRPESPADYTHDYMRQLQWLERRGMSQLLRIPGVQPEYEHDRWGPDGPTMNQAGAGDARHTPAPKAVGKPQAEVGCFGTGAPKPSTGKKEVPEVENLEDATPLETLMKRSTHTWYLTKFARFMGLWMPYDSYSKHAMGLGIIALGQGSAYWALGTLISEGRFIDEWAALLLAAAFVYSVTVILFQNFTMQEEQINLYGAALVFVLGPIFGGIAATSDNKIIEQVCAPLCMLAHAFFWGGASISAKHVVHDKKLDLLSENSNLWKTQVGREAVRSEGTQHVPIHRVRGQVVAGRRWQRENDPVKRQIAGEAAKGSNGYVVGYPPEQQAGGNDVEGGFTSRSDMWPTDHDEFDVRQSGTVEKIKRTMQLTLFLSAFLWFGVFIWATTKYWWAPLAAGGPPELSMTDASYAWPSPLFRPHALACSAGKVFAADKFRVWDLSEASASPVRCNLTWPIIDIAANCEGPSTSACRIFALVQPESPQGGPLPAEVIECGNGTPYPLLQGPAHQIAVSSEGSNLALLVEHDGDLSEYLWSSDEGWLPQYYIGHISYSPVRSLSTVGQRLFVFYAVPLGKAAVESLDITSVSMQEEWALPESKPLIAGCSPRDGEALLLLGSWDTASRNSGPELHRTKL